MKILKKKPPRKFYVGNNIELKDCAKIYLNPNEQVTFLTTKKQEYDVCKKDWGFYATPSINGRLKSFNFQTALIKNIKTKKIYIFLIEKGKQKKFYKYIKKEKCKVIKWLSK
tara:strand:- start:440 stop:775 length:336 start_codon:yes stop_codon:yes gene_type:complete